MDKSKFFKKKSYSGIVTLINPKTAAPLLDGTGVYVVEQNKLYTQFQTIEIVDIQEYFLLFETYQGQCILLLGEFGAFSQTPMRGVTEKEYSMRNFAICKNKNSLKNLITNGIEQATVTLEGVSGKKTLTTSEDWDKVSMKKYGERKKLDSRRYKDMSITLFSSYSASLPCVSLNNFLSIDLKLRETIAVDNYHKIISALELYWILYKSGVIFELYSFGIFAKGSKERIEVFYDRKPIPCDQNTTGVNTSSPEIAMATLHNIFTLFLNPSKVATSKMEVGFLRLIKHVKTKGDIFVDDYISNGIIALDCICESIFSNTARPANQQRRNEMITGINNILDLVSGIKDDLPRRLSDFYLKDVNQIYEMVSRPTFKERVEKVIKRYGIDCTKYEKTIKAANKARRQVIHGQDYDSETLTKSMLSKNKITIGKSQDGKNVSIRYGVDEGELEKIVGLLLEIGRVFFRGR